MTTTLTAPEVRRLRQQRRAGSPAVLLALEFGVSVATVHDVSAGRSWAHTGGPLTKRPTASAERRRKRHQT